MRLGGWAVPKLVTWAMAGLSLLLVLMVLGRWVVHGPVDGRTLLVSVERAVGGDVLPTGECRPQQDSRTWLCRVFYQRGGSSLDEVIYRVVVEPDSSCWKAQRGNVSLGPMTADGCVHRWQWSLEGILDWAADNVGVVRINSR